MMEVCKMSIVMDYLATDIPQLEAGSTHLQRSCILLRRQHKRPTPTTPHPNQDRGRNENRCMHYSRSLT